MASQRALEPIRLKARLPIGAAEEASIAEDHGAELQARVVQSMDLTNEPGVEEFADDEATVADRAAAGDRERDPWGSGIEEDQRSERRCSQ